MGPILEEFKNRRNELTETVQSTYLKGLENRDKTIPKSELKQIITAQGGVGTSEEHNFLTEFYNLDSNNNLVKKC